MNAVALVEGTQPLSVEKRSAAVKRYRAASKSAETKRAIEKAWRAFGRWAAQRALAAFPCQPETLEAYLVDLAERGFKVATIEQARYAVNVRHKLAGQPAPGESHLVKTALAGIRRALGTRVRQSAALTMDHLRSISFPDTIQGKRDRALLMTAVAGGFRRSEISSLQVVDVQDSEHGIRLLLRRSKGDQEGAGAWVDVVRGVSPRHCPVVALREWLAIMGRGSGPLFPSLRRWGRIGDKALSPEGVNLLVKWAAEQCGLNPAEFSGHSPRAGCATFLLDRGVSLNVVANHLRHKSINTTRRYDRNATAKALSGVY